MAHVDPATLLFTDLSDEDAAHLTDLAYRLLFSSGLTQEEPLVEVWMKAGGFDNRQRLLMLATVFPARALYSVLRRTGRDLDALFKQGDVNIHNVGPDHVIIDFLPTGGSKMQGSGPTLHAALESLPR